MRQIVRRILPVEPDELVQKPSFDLLYLVLRDLQPGECVHPARYLLLAPLAGLLGSKQEIPCGVHAFSWLEVPKHQIKQVERRLLNEFVRFHGQYPAYNLTHK